MVRAFGNREASRAAAARVDSIGNDFIADRYAADLRSNHDYDTC